MSYSPYHSTIYLDTIKVQIISLKARATKAECYKLNRNMDFEVELLEAQIIALEDEYDRIQVELT